MKDVLAIMELAMIDQCFRMTFSGTRAVSSMPLLIESPTQNHPRISLVERSQA